MGSYDAAATEVSRAIRLLDREAQFHGLRGAIRMQQERYDDAIINFNRAIDRDPEYFGYYLHRGAIKSKQGKRDEARQDLERSMSLLPTAQAQEMLKGLQ